MTVLNYGEASAALNSIYAVELHFPDGTTSRVIRSAGMKQSESLLLAAEAIVRVYCRNLPERRISEQERLKIVLRFNLVGKDNNPLSCTLTHGLYRQLADYKSWCIADTLKSYYYNAYTPTELN